MGIFDFLKGEPRIVTLDVATIQTWPEKLIRLQRLDKGVEELRRKVDGKRHTIAAVKGKLTHPTIKDNLDERLLPIHDAHVPIIVDAVDELLDEADFFGGVFLLEEQQQQFLDRLQTYRDTVQKSSASLREIHGQLLHRLDTELKELEDIVLAGGTMLEERRFDDIKSVKALIERRDGEEQRRSRIIELKQQMDVKLLQLQDKRERIVNKIDHYMEKATDERYQELFATEAELRTRREDIRAQELDPAKEQVMLKPLDDQLVLLRKQMLHDITALNISEQRAFLEATNDDLRKVKKNLVKLNHALEESSMENFLLRLQEHLEQFSVRVEDASTIYEEEAHVVPQ